MFFKSLKYSLRFLSKRPVMTGINLFGLSVSIAVVLILSSYSINEFYADTHHSDVENKYIICEGLDGLGGYTPAVLTDKVLSKIPEINYCTRFKETFGDPVFQVEGSEPLKTNLIFADSTFFDMFSYNFIEGGINSALTKPMSVVLLKSEAIKFFGDEPALGKTLKLNNRHILTVSAVVEEKDSQSFLKFKAIAPLTSITKIQPNGDELTSWNMGNFQTFINIKGGNRKYVGEKINNLAPRNSFSLYPLKDIYFSDIKIPFSEGYFMPGNKNRVIILVIISSLVLLIALINYANLSGSQLFDKLRQTGIVKIVGGGKFSIIIKSILEAVIIFSISFMMALLLAFMIAPRLEFFTGIRFTNSLLYSPLFIGTSVLSIFVLAVSVSVFQAIPLAFSRPIDNLNTTVLGSESRFPFKTTLIVTQFVICISLLAGTVIIRKQVKFGTTNLGFNKDNIITIKMTDQLNEKKNVLREELLSQAGIKRVGYSQYHPQGRVSHWRGWKANVSGEEKELEFNLFQSDGNFVRIIGVELVAGQIFSQENIADKNKVLVNERFIKEYSIPNPIGFKFGDFEIAGVVKDYHFKSKSEALYPLVIRNGTYSPYCYIQITTTNYSDFKNIYEKINKTSSGLSPRFPVEIGFLDKAVERMYIDETRFQNAFTLFSVIALMNSCLGILGLSIFAAQHRTKEIGVRKVNGAKVTEIIALLNADFVKWVFMAFVIATPVAYYSMNKWLENFAYKTDMSWWIFALAGAIALIIALLTVSWQSWRAATRNPVEALRYE